MNKYRFILAFAASLLILTGLTGLISAWLLATGHGISSSNWFRTLKPIHVSAAMLWILSAAQFLVIYHAEKISGKRSGRLLHSLHFSVWIAAIVTALLQLAGGQYGGREYWEFPPATGWMIAGAWAIGFVRIWRTLYSTGERPPVYIWMWLTGFTFFLITFAESQLWQLEWFREKIIRDITVQWKANGSMVGSWNQLVYGLSFYVMEVISGDKTIARSRKTYFFYFLGFTNLMFNWGHHIYNLPASPWIRIISYAISMTEWIILLNIINDFKNSEKGLFSEKNLSTCFLGWSEFWVLMNLMLALLMSIPAVNRYTHGSLITVAHSMGTTIGINSMILLGVLFHTLGRSGELTGRRIIRVFNVSLLAFWLILIGAGMAMFNHKTQMAGSLHEPHMRIWLLTFASAGIFVASGIIWSGAAILRALKTSVRQP